MERFKSLNSVFNLDDFLVGWFLSTPPNAESIPRGNIEEFVSYGFFCRRARDLGPEDAGAVARFIRDAERLWSVKFQPGYDPKLSYMAHVWEPLRVHHKLLVNVIRCLCMYACMYVCMYVLRDII